MKNHSYNSLTQKLIQNGILSSDLDNNENFFEIPQTTPVVENLAVEEHRDKKRINQLDLDIIPKAAISNTINFKTIALLKVLKKLVDFKKDKGNNKDLKLKNLFFRFFPNLYKAELVKNAMNELLELNIDAKALLDKTIPYGERDSRYEDLIKYISCANEIQANLKKKI